MEFITYLKEHFLTKSELLEQSKIDEEDLAHYQKQGVMPDCSYALTLAIESDSYFGKYADNQNLQYYAKGYVAWLGMLQSLEVITASKVFTLFKERYIKTMESFEARGYHHSAQQLRPIIDSHVQQEWEYFLDGTYGLCTKSGLPEDIAVKELAIIEIKALLSMSTLADEQLSQLTRFVNQLDKVSALFAPHERLASSRQKLINEVRRTYQL